MHHFVNRLSDAVDSLGKFAAHDVKTAADFAADPLQLPETFGNIVAAGVDLITGAVGKGDQVFGFDFYRIDHFSQIFNRFGAALVKVVKTGIKRILGRPQAFRHRVGNVFKFVRLRGNIVFHQRRLGNDLFRLVNKEVAVFGNFAVNLLNAVVHVFRIFNGFLPAGFDQLVNLGRHRTECFAHRPGAFHRLVGNVFQIFALRLNLFVNQIEVFFRNAAVGFDVFTGFHNLAGAAFGHRLDHIGGIFDFVHAGQQVVDNAVDISLQTGGNT